MQPRLAPYAYLALNARHFKIQLELDVVRVWAGVGEIAIIGDENEGSETKSNGYHQMPAWHASQQPCPPFSETHNGRSVTLHKKFKSGQPPS